MNSEKINKINKIISKPIKKSQCLQVITYDEIFYHPYFNFISVINPKYNDNKKLCLTINNDKNIYKDYNNEDIVGIYSHFHLSINLYNFTSIIYNINNINDLNIWIDENLDTITIKTLNRILYCYCISNIKDIINNVILFINIIKKILNYFNIEYDNDILDKNILDVIKNKKNINIDFIENLKKYLKNQK